MFALSRGGNESIELTNEEQGTMIELTEQQQQELRQGGLVRVHPSEVGSECVIIRADVYERLRSAPDDDLPDMQAVGKLIEHNMREDDENDPLLDSYQQERP
jgi:hypothetical protein